MKAYSYTCPTEVSAAIRDKLIRLGANVLRLVSKPAETERSLPTTVIVFVVDEETDLRFKLTFPPGTFKECSA